jgi:hypothetical protein
MKTKAILLLSTSGFLAACGGSSDGVMSTNNFTISDIETVAVVNNSDTVIKYSVTQNDESFQGYVITNEPDSWQNGVFQQVSLSDVQITDILDFAPRNVYVGNVTYNGIEYRGFVYVNPDNDKIELLMAEPSSTTNGGWNFGEDNSLPSNTIIRALGQTSSPITLTGTAQYRGAIMVQGGDGRMIGEAIMDVNFDTFTGTFSASSPSSPRIFADVSLNNADGSFSSENLIVTFNTDIFNPQRATGKLAGNFTGSDQNGAIGAIWSDTNETQFQGAFALDKR